MMFNVGSFLYYPLKEFINIYNHKQNKFTIKNENIMNNFQYEDKNDIIMKLYYKLYNKGLVSGLIQFTKEDKYRHNNYIAIKKFIITQRNLPFNYYNTWIPAWHGTKFNYLESIVENGLRLPGTKLKNGIITQSPNNIPFREDVLGIKNWENAIFASQNIYYSLGYCDIIGEREEKFDPYPIPDNWGWKGLVEVRIKPNSFTKHKSQFVIPYFAGHFSLHNNEDIDDIYRIESEKNVFVTSIVFINYCYILYSNGEKQLINFS